MACFCYHIFFSYWPEYFSGSKRENIIRNYIKKILYLGLAFSLPSLFSFFFKGCFCRSDSFLIFILQLNSNWFVFLCSVNLKIAHLKKSPWHYSKQLLFLAHSHHTEHGKLHDKHPGKFSLPHFRVEANATPCHSTQNEIQVNTEKDLVLKRRWSVANKWPLKCQEPGSAPQEMMGFHFSTPLVRPQHRGSQLL